MEIFHRQADRKKVDKIDEVNNIAKEIKKDCCDMAWREGGGDPTTHPDVSVIPLIGGRDPASVGTSMREVERIKLSGNVTQIAKEKHKENQMYKELSGNMQHKSQEPQDRKLKAGCNTDT